MVGDRNSGNDTYVKGWDDDDDDDDDDDVLFACASCAVAMDRSIKF